jgi:hypothetical protein
LLIVVALALEVNVIPTKKAAAIATTHFNLFF